LEEGQKRDDWRRERKLEADEDIFNRNILAITEKAFTALTRKFYKDHGIEMDLRLNPGFPYPDLFQNLVFKEAVEKKTLTEEAYDLIMKCLLKAGALKDEFRDRLIKYHATTLSGLKGHSKFMPSLVFEKVDIEVVARPKEKKYRKMGVLDS